MGEETAMRQGGDHSGLLVALERAGYRTTLRRKSGPALIEARRDGGTGFSIRIWVLGGGADEGTLRQPRLPRGRPPEWERGLTRVVLSHSPERSLYVGVPGSRSKAPVSFPATGIVDYLDSLTPRKAAPPARAPADHALVPPSAAMYRTADALLREDAPLAIGYGARRRKPIETGFAAPASPAAALDREMPLEPAREYLFWFGAGTGTGVSIETREAAIPEEVPDRARLAVEVFGFEGELVPAGPTRGELEVTGTGARVLTPAHEVDLAAEDADERIFFAVTTPPRPGVHRLRCNLYYGSTLVQSRLVRAAVGGMRREGGPALESVLDYQLSSSLDSVSLAELPSHDLSLSVNGSGDTHEFRFYRGGEEEEDLFRSEASLPSGKVTRSIRNGRKALRRVSWGKPGKWNGKASSYRYKRKPARRHFESDLVTLARAGANLYSELATRLAGGAADRRALEKVAGAPGRIQIASANDGLYVPAALFYDHRIHPANAGRAVRLCAAFGAEMESGRGPLEKSPCMLDGCANSTDPAVVCPSGFWGFRHEIGWPTSAGAPVTRLRCDGAPGALIGVSTDRALVRRRVHERELTRMVPGNAVVVRTLGDFDAELKRREAHLVYMYCHGGVDESSPYVELGRRNGGDWITYDHLRQGAPWGKPPPRALVFINGCHTAALGPEEVLDLVGGFVEEAEAAGVIGTELTVFEQLACDFANAMLPGFLSGQQTVGAAVRHARLELLRERNPLGLVYVPFVAADTRIVHAAGLSAQEQHGTTAKVVDPPG